jgi:simple sugar transport system permease protein
MVSSEFIIGLLATGVTLATPVIFAAIGELFAELSGVLNLGTEGMMLMGSFFAFWASYCTKNVWMGVLAAAAVGALMGAIYAIICIRLKFNQTISGVALWFVGWGLSSFFYRTIFGVREFPPIIEGFGDIPIPLLSDIPYIGPILFNHNPLVYLAILLVLITWVILTKTRWGLEMKAVGENPRAADTLGINVFLIRYRSVIIAGMLAAIGGSFFSLAWSKTFLDNATAGRGWIGVAMVCFGRWRPILTAAGAFMFGFADSLQAGIQSLQLGIPYQIALIIPYLLTIIVLILTSRKAVPPRALGVPYERS